MGFQKKKPKKKIWTKQEQDWINEKLNVYKKWHRPLKGRFVGRRDDISQEVVYTARYNTEDELKIDAERTIAHLNEMDQNGHWSLVSYEVISRDKAEDIDEEESKD